MFFLHQIRQYSKAVCGAQACAVLLILKVSFLPVGVVDQANPPAVVLVGQWLRWTREQLEGVLAMLQEFMPRVSFCGPYFWGGVKDGTNRPQSIQIPEYSRGSEKIRILNRILANHCKFEFGGDKIGQISKFWQTGQYYIANGFLNGILTESGLNTNRIWFELNHAKYWILTLNIEYWISNHLSYMQSLMELYCFAMLQMLSLLHMGTAAKKLKPVYCAAG